MIALLLFLSLFSAPPETPKPKVDHRHHRVHYTRYSHRFYTRQQRLARDAREARKHGNQSKNQ